MQPKQSELEITLFTFAISFTILSISAYSVSVAYGVAPMFRTVGPWIVLLIIALVITAGVWFRRRASYRANR